MKESFDDCVEQLYIALCKRQASTDIVDLQHIHLNLLRKEAHVVHYMNTYFYVSKVLWGLRLRNDIDAIVDEAWEQFEVYKIMNG